MSTRILRYYDDDDFGDNNNNKNNNNKKVNRRKRVSLTFPCSFNDDNKKITNIYGKHRRGINGILAVAPLDSIFTCGRDGFVRQWEVSKEKGGVGSSLTCRKIFEGHDSWVSGVACTADYQTLITSSHDLTMKLWRIANLDDARGEQAQIPFTRPICTVASHKDYVKKISYSPLKNIVASVGLDSQLLVWDITEKGKPFAKFGKPHVVGKHKNSLYALDLSNDGNTIVTGGLEKMIYVWDVRTNGKNNNSNVKIEGHDHYIRCLKWLNNSNNIFVSASSDNTVKAWDLRTNKCLFTSSPHDDSVFAVAISNDNKFVYSSGKDNNIFQTSFSNGESNLIGKIEGGEDVNVLDLCYEDKFDDPLWIATEKPCIEGWGSKPGMAPRIIDKGYGSVKKHRLMHNHVEIAIEDDSNPHKVYIWNALNATITKKLEDGLKIDEMKEDDEREKDEDHDKKKSKKKKSRFSRNNRKKDEKGKDGQNKSRKWFDVKTWSGNITITLDERQCFKCPLDNVNSDLVPENNSRANRHGHNSTGTYFLSNVFKDIVDDLNANKLRRSDEDAPGKFDEVILTVTDVVPGHVVEPLCFHTRLKDFFENCDDDDLPQWFLEGLRLESD